MSKKFNQAELFGRVVKPRHRMTWKQAVSLSIGDRDAPLEADAKVDMDFQHSMVGKAIEVSCIAGGSLKDHRGKKAKILGVVSRFGQPVGYLVRITEGGEEELGVAKDFYLDRCLVEDAQPPTATSAALREGLSHWGQQRDYWHIESGGLESLAFAVASVTPQAIATPYEWGWDFSVPDPMKFDFTQVRCPAFQHGNYWSMTTAVSPLRGGMQPMVNPIEDHWARTFHWTHTIAKGMVQFDWPWQKAVRSIEARAKATAKILAPMVNEALAQCIAARKDITGQEFDPLPGSVSAGFSTVRLKAGTVGLTEPPTDRRPYTVISVAPSVAADREYLHQVVLHECVHIAVNSNGGPPHNDLFNALSERVGLNPEHRD